MVVHYVGSGSGSSTSTVAGDVWIYANGYGYYTTTSATVFSASTAAKVYNYGTIAATTFTAVFFNSATGDNRLFNGSTGSITGTDAVAVAGSAYLAFRNEGTVIGTQDSTADDVGAVVALQNSELTFDNQGYVYSPHYAVAISGAAKATINNYGTLEADDAGIFVNTTADYVYINNQGEIVSPGASIKVVQAPMLYLINAGDMYFAQLTGAAKSDVTNTGTISFYLSGGGEDTIHNSGKISSSVDLGGGTDSYTGEKGSTSGSVYGRAGTDTLSAADPTAHLYGGAGGDTYINYAHSAGVIYDESAQGGETDNAVDTVLSTVNFSLASSQVLGKIENLSLFYYPSLGYLAVNGTGNALANTITGNDANNILNGGAGADKLLGGVGNDTYYVDNSGDVVDEGVVGSTGSDLVYSSVNFSLADTVHAKGTIEKLTLIGSAINATGNGASNVLTGNGAANVMKGGALNDTLVGGAGKDTLYGEAGSDSFRFNARTEGGDTIKDFVHTSSATTSDHLVFLKSAFGGISAINSANFVENTSGKAVDASDRFIYETDTRTLRFDDDGSGAHAAVVIATLNVAHLFASDFLFV